VVVVPESVGVAADLLGEHVGVLDSTVGGSAGSVVGEDLVGPAADGSGEPGDFGDSSVGAPGVEGDETAPGASFAVGGVHVAESFFGDPSCGDFPVGVPDVQECPRVEPT